MPATTGNAQTKKDRGKMVFTRIFIVIITTATIINITSLSAGAVFLTRSITSSMENNMLVSVDIADKYVTKEIELLKFWAAEAARELYLLDMAGAGKGALEQVLFEHPVFTGMAVFDETALLDFRGAIAVPQDLCREPFMRIALTGRGAVSTTMRGSDGSLVMYVSARISEGRVLAAVLPGMYFNDKMTRMEFWESGHLYTWDEEGTVISNIRAHWVHNRNNFFEMAERDSAFNGVASVIARGIRGERGIGHYRIDDVPRICAFRPITSETENWFIGIVAPLPESSLNDIPRGILLIGGIMMLLSVAAAFVAAALLKRPYQEADRLRIDAEIASVSKSAFLANMSHEIRTPMNSIIGFSELALDNDVSPKTRDYLDKIRTNAEWLLEIINDILDISKVESGKMELEKIPFDLHELFTSCRTLIMPKAVEKGIVLYFYAEPSLGIKPLGDPTRLRQVLINLLSNAVKFTNTGMVKLQAVVTNSNEGNITVHFEVRDSGIGMTAEQMHNIFEPFTQAETGTTRKYGGTGLGLAITKNIVELMGGTISVESVLGVGSKFSFDLSFDTISLTGDEIDQKQVSLNELEKPVFEGEVLLCEDNTMNQQVISEHLLRVGLKTVIAENGKMGVDHIKSRMEKGEKQFDLIFMDIHMPVMDGLEAAAIIQEFNTGVPIIAMTANVMDNDRDIYKMRGMNDCVGKPFTSQELWRCLLKYLAPAGQGNTHKKSGPDVPAAADTEFLRKLQVTFVNDNRNKYEELAKALEEENIDLAYRIAHTMKSNAGHFGKTLLQQASADIEEQLKGGKNLVTPQQLAVFETELQALLVEYDLLLGGEAKPQAPVSVPAGTPPADVRELFEKLEPLLKSGNPECIHFSDDLRALPGSGRIIQCMEEFDFEAAHSALTEFRKGWM